MYPKGINELIKNLKKLPGIGLKTAERLALELLNWDEEALNSFGESLKSFKDEIKYCEICGLITDSNICNICKDPKRNNDVIMVVSDSKDVFSFEKTSSFNGKYH